MFKTVPQVYRDCLRLIDHIGGQSRKADVMRKLVAREFRAHSEEKDEKKIEHLKRKSVTARGNRWQPNIPSDHTAHTQTHAHLSLSSALLCFFSSVLCLASRTT